MTLFILVAANALIQMCHELTTEAVNKLWVVLCWKLQNVFWNCWFKTQLMVMYKVLCERKLWFYLSTTINLQFENHDVETEIKASTIPETVYGCYGYTQNIVSLRFCIRDGYKGRQTKAYSLCGWKLSFQLAGHPVTRSIHLSGLSLVATLRACSLSHSLSCYRLQLLSDPDPGQPLPLSVLSSTEEAGDRRHRGRLCLVTAHLPCLHQTN